MKKRMNWKRVALAGLLLVLLLGISGCLQKPDTVESMPTDPVNVLPFELPTASPSPAPTDASGFVDPNAGQDGVAVITNPPSATQTIALVTPTPTAVPVWTYSPGPTATPTSDGTLRVGSTGAAVRNLQQRLKTLGYYSGSVDGDFGSGTESALKDFQRTNGLGVDGIAGSRTLSAINSSNAKSKPRSTVTAKATQKPGVNATPRPTPKFYTPSEPNKYKYFLQLGSTGSRVTQLQNRLKELGYYRGAVSGTFDEATEEALIAFQKRNGEWADGVAGEDTLTRLYSDQALPTAGGSDAGSIGYRTLQSGLSGDDVSLLQDRLKELGYFTATVDGQYGSSTAVAVLLFQQYNGLNPDGVAGGTTQARIYSNNALYAPTDTAADTRPAIVDTLQQGSIGEEVYRLQERLYDLGYYTGRIDGIFSDAVVTAVRAFQTTNKLTVDGKAGRDTQRRIYADNAIAAKGGVDDVYTTLRQGDSGERVRALQGMLATYNYFTDEITGDYGLSTTYAVQQLQARNDLLVDGVAGPATLQLLYEGAPRYAATADEIKPSTVTYPTLRSGMDGPDVMMLQEFLYELGYFDGEMNGEFSGSTLLAVQAFQDRNGMNPDGVAGTETLALLYSGLGVPSENFGANVLGAALPEQTQAPKRTTMKQGDEGQDVFDMQWRLSVLGYLTDEPDGQYGSATVSAVKAFQEKNGLTADGEAGEKTVTAMFAATAVPAAVRAAALEPVSNQIREITEQETTGAIQGSLAGGGIAASFASNLYYTGKGGTLYMRSGSSNRQIYDGKASYIHAADQGVTFVSGNKIMRVPTRGGNATTLATVGGIKKLAVWGDMLYYQDGNALVKQNTKGDTQILMTGINDFTLDVYQYAAYTASDTGIRVISLNGMEEELISSTKTQQVQICDSTLFFRSGGSIYRLDDGIGTPVVGADASWMGIYRDKVYYISGNVLYRCDTNGENNGVFYDGATAEVSFVSGSVYITAKAGGEVTEILQAE